MDSFVFSFKMIKEAVTTHNNKISAYSNCLPSLSAPATRYVYLIAGTHGDEPESTYVLCELIREDYFSKLSYPIIFITAINPDGLKDSTRCNANKVDLNRNFPAYNWSTIHTADRYFPGNKPSSEIETQFLVELLNGCPPQFIISFHSWKRILNHNNHQHSVHLAQLIAKHNNYHVSDYIGYSTPGSLESYVADKLNCGLITYELPVMEQPALQMSDIWRENQNGLKAALEFLITTYD